MNNFLQDTYSRSWFDSKELTTSVEGQADTFRLRGESNPTRQARDIISQIQNPNVAKQLDSLLSIIDNLFYVAKQSKVDISRIPPLRPYIDEDDSVLLEWIFPDFRIGFNLEPNPDDSGYHMVSNKQLRETTTSGQLVDMNGIIVFLLRFIFSNI